MQLQVPENLRPTIYFEDSFKGEKSNQYSSYIDGIRGLITGYQGTNLSFRDYEQVHDFENQEKIQFENELLNDLTKIVTEEIAVESIIDSQTNLIADSTHKWGLANFHYIPEYYSALDQQLMSWFSGFNE